MENKRKRTVLAVLIVLNLAFIWGNSMLDRGASASLSGRVLELILKLLRLPASESSGGGGHLLRKIAHFSEFACLGVLVSDLLRLLRKPFVQSAALACLASACFDETIQLFVAGRGSSLLDVWLDFSGAVTGILAVWFIFVYLQRRRNV